MNKKELVAEVARRANITAKDSEMFVDTVFDAISDHLVENDKVVISNFGTFEVRVRAARTGINPATGESISIPEQRTPAFKAGKQLKDRLR